MSASTQFTKIAVVAALLYAARRYYRNWGTTKGECKAPLPGDEMLGEPAIQVTEAIWIDSPPAIVWPLLLRMGLGRGARGSRFALENMAGLRMHESERSGREWKPLAAGDTLRLKPDGWMGLRGGLAFRVEAVTPERDIVLSAVAPALPNVVWSFRLQSQTATHTRLLARARVGLRHPGEVVVVELARPAIALLIRKVLLRIKDQAQRQSEDLAAVQIAD
ncbi:SRPBCC family protein [Mycobacterium paraterrae]|uniref:SRPBCC family protein n=1 Tax=Mycobacterium paraterrae TaxID=577492 RepID=A0ABY3VWA3_9MYCO|nr:SRPBCC family protein [Mycobacterium paraterrae]UMB70880.1 SRPBCC family protein [Mycobacterium paraterrae]